MTTEKEHLEAEIAERDARIAELERQGAALAASYCDGVIGDSYGHAYCKYKAELAALKAQQPSAGVADERAAFEDAMGASILAEQGKFSLSRSYDAGNPYTFLATRWAYEGWQARARLNTTHTSAGVVLPERMELDGNGGWRDLRAETHNRCLDEVARLNPCSAQAVPGWTEAVEACAKLCEERAAYYESGDDDAPGSRRGNACRNCADVIRYSLADAPSAKKESE